MNLLSKYTEEACLCAEGLSEQTMGEGDRAPNGAKIFLKRAV